MAQGRILSLHFMASFPEFELLKQQYHEQNVFDSPLVALCLSWLRQDRDRERKKKRDDPEAPLKSTEKVATQWDELSENTEKFGDKYYNYWK